MDRAEALSSRRVRFVNAAVTALAVVLAAGCGTDNQERDAAREVAKHMWFPEESFQEARDLGSHRWLLIYRSPPSFRCHMVTDPLDDDVAIWETTCPQEFSMFDDDGRH